MADVLAYLSSAAGQNADLIATTVSKAENALIQRYDFYWAVASAVATVLLVVFSFLGFGALRNVRQGIRDELRNDLREELLQSRTLKDEIRLSIQSDILSEFKQSSDKLGRQIRFSRFQYLANRLREKGGGISNDDRDALFHSIIDLKDDPDIINDVEFTKALEQVLDIFYGTSIWDKFDQIEENLSSVMINHIGIINTCIDSYGLRVLGEIDVDELTISRFQKYLDVAEDKNYLEIALPWQYAWSVHREGGDHRSVDLLIDKISDLDDSEFSMFAKVIERWSNIENISSNPKSFHRRVIEKFAAARALPRFIQAYPQLAMPDEL